MAELPDIPGGEIGLLIGPRAGCEPMLELTAALALQGPVRILDGGNSFNVYRVARQIRRRTSRLTETLNRISVARAFTCYQVVTLFEETAVAPFPHLALDLLATFYDENISLAESCRLLQLVAVHLQRLRQHAPVIISLHPPHQPERALLVQLLMDIADHVSITEPPIELTPLRLL